jgi:hypothetical protein
MSRNANSVATYHTIYKLRVHLSSCTQVLCPPMIKLTGSVSTYGQVHLFFVQHIQNTEFLCPPVSSRRCKGLRPSWSSNQCDCTQVSSCGHQARPIIPAHCGTLYIGGGWRMRGVRHTPLLPPPCP